MEAQDGSAENPQLGLIDNDGLTEDGDSTDTTEPAEETDMQDGQKQTAQMLKAEIPQKEN